MQNIEPIDFFYSPIHLPCCLQSPARPIIGVLSGSTKIRYSIVIDLKLAGRHVKNEVTFFERDLSNHNIFITTEFFQYYFSKCPI